MQQKSLATVEKSETKEVVVDECQLGADDDIQQIEAAVTFGDRNFCTGRRVTVHVIDVATQGGVSVVY